MMDAEELQRMYGDGIATDEELAAMFSDDDDETLSYIYQADVYCEDCATAIKQRLESNGILATIRQKYGDDATLTDETTFDSDDYPKGPYSNDPNTRNFTGYSDYEVFCGGCCTPLHHPLATPAAH